MGELSHWSEKPAAHQKRAALMHTVKSIETEISIRQTNCDFSAAFSRGEADAVLLPPSMDVVCGREAIRGFWETAMRMGVKEAVLESFETEGADAMAWEVGFYTLSGANKQMLDRGKYVVVWHKEDGQWLLHRDIWNSSVASSTHSAHPS